MPRMSLSFFAVLSFAAASALSFATEGTAHAEDAPAAAGDDASVDSVVDGMQNFYDASQSFCAKFTQTFKVKAHGREDKSSGNVVFRKDGGKMRFKYDNGNHVVTDGHKVKVFQKGDRQLFVKSIEKSQFPVLDFLRGKGKLRDSFNFTINAGMTEKFKNGYVLEGSPKNDAPEYKKVFFYVDKATKQMRRVVILDTHGNRNQMNFEAPRLNCKAVDSDFEFTPPKDTNIVEGDNTN